jgi:putative ABC transport system substrate-binding protein
MSGEQIRTGRTAIGRRALLALFGAGLMTPLPALAAGNLPTIGVLWHAGNADEETAFRIPLREGFSKLGYIEGKNIVFDECYAGENAEGFKRCAAELVERKVNILIAPAIPSARAAQQLTSTIPIILVANPDPVGLRFVASLSRPGGNITGLSSQTFDIMAQRVEVLKEGLPSAAHLGLLVSPSTSYEVAHLLEQMQPALDTFQITVEIVEARQPDDLAGAFRDMADRKVDAAIVSQNAMYYNERKRIADVALEHHLPTMAPADLFVEAGALMSYGPSWPPIFRNVARFADKILKGVNPADLPIEQPTVFELTVNRRTATALGIELPAPLFVRADRVIE